MLQCPICKLLLTEPFRVIAEMPKIVMEYIQVEKVIFSILNGFIKITDMVEEPNQTTIWESKEAICCKKCAHSSELVQLVIKDETQYQDSNWESPKRRLHEPDFDSTKQRLAYMRNEE